MTSDKLVDINADVGESFGAFTVGEDDGVMESATSVNVAAGFHGGDPRTIERVIRRAATLGIGVGVHPGFPDLVGFGRRSMELAPDEVRTDTIYQIGAVQALAAGVELCHVKPHGQLNNQAVKDARLAAAIVQAVRAVNSSLILVAYGGELTRAGMAADLRVAHEAYADREYAADGALVSRRVAGAVIHDIDRITERAVGMVNDGEVTAMTGERLSIRVDTICVHADTPGSARIARSLRGALQAAGIEVAPLRRVLERRAAGVGVKRVSG